MLHGVKDENSLRDVVVLVGSKPVGEDRVRGSAFFVFELSDLDASI